LILGSDILFVRSALGTGKLIVNKATQLCGKIKKLETKAIQLDCGCGFSLLFSGNIYRALDNYSLFRI